MSGGPMADMADSGESLGAGLSATLAKCLDFQSLAGYVRSVAWPTMCF